MDRNSLGVFGVATVLSHFPPTPAHWLQFPSPEMVRVGRCLCIIMESVSHYVGTNGTRHIVRHLTFFTMSWRGLHVVY